MRSTQGGDLSEVLQAAASLTSDADLEAELYPLVFSAGLGEGDRDEVFKAARRATGKRLGALRNDWRDYQRERDAEAVRASTTLRRVIRLDLPQVVVNGRALRDISADAEAALQKGNDPPVLFKRGGEIVRLSRYPALHVRPLDAVGLKGALDRAADFVTQKGSEERPARPPADLAPDLLARADVLALPTLSVLATTPLFTADGTLISTPGYHHASGTYLATEGLSGVEASLSSSQARQYLDELLHDFPFQPRDAGRAHTVAALLQPFVRDLIDGPTPMYLVDAPTRGSGKSLLADAISHVATGASPGVMVRPGSDDELEKRVTSLLLEGARIILLDNVHALGGGTLAGALTARVWKGRRLGRSEMLYLPNHALWLATGNNPKLDDDMPRRVIPIRLDPGMERPEERGSFKHPNLIAWIKARRNELVSACVSLVRNWQLAGGRQGTKRLGSYESWAGVLGGVLEAAGIPGFLDSRDYLYQAANAEPQEWTQLLAGIHREHGSAPVGAAAFLRVMRSEKLLLPLWADRSDLAATQKIGHALKHRRDRVFGDFVVTWSGMSSLTGNLEYRVIRASHSAANT